MLMIIRKSSYALFISALLIILVASIIPVTYAVSKSKKQAITKRTRKIPSRTLKSKVRGHRLKVLSKNPYNGAVVVDADTGDVLFEKNADFMGYPASMVKMMDLLVILEAVDEGYITLKDNITVSAEVAGMGGSQVYLKEKEVHTVEDLLYALMVQSANDAALALALHYKGSTEAFVEVMNEKAEELGMHDTVFHSVHGLPPARGQLPDMSTPRDMAKLGRALLRHPDALQYTSTKKRLFRPEAPEPFIMRNHNHLVRDFEGCDGLKTGYFRAAGFSIAATAAQNGSRALAVLIGSVSSRVRDANAKELLAKSLEDMASHSRRTASLAQEAVLF
jgi:D-alanyl-D-alanine carboxypeptidase (penicillin-binding protein 5/6)